MPTEQYSIDLQGVPEVLATLLLSASLAAAVILFVLLIARPLQWPAMRAGMDRRPWSLRHTGLLATTIAVGIFAMNLSYTLACKAGLNNWQFPVYSWLVVAMVFVHLPCLAAIWIVTRREHISLDYGFGLKINAETPKLLATGAFLTLATLPLVALVTIPYLRLLQSLGVQCDPQSVALMIQNTADTPWPVRIAVGALAAILVPAIEELVFRGVAFPALARRLGTLPAAILISLVFAVMHEEVPTYAPLFVLSMVFCLAYARTGSLLVPFAMHATHNVIQIALLPFVELHSGSAS